MRRSLVGWLIGEPTSDAKAAFAARGIELDTPLALAGGRDVTFDGMRAVILAQTETLSNEAFLGEIEKNAEAVLDNGCIFIVRPLLKGEASTLNRMRTLPFPKGALQRDEQRRLAIFEDGVQPLPHVHFFGSKIPWHAVANFIADHEPSSQMNRNLEVTGATLVADQFKLICRAFSDCAKLHLRLMPEQGHSGASVYEAYADLQSGDLGPWPQPYFVKIGPRAKIFREYRNYRDRIHPYVPFYLAPRLLSERCHLGARSGIIVGDFVDESEDLLQCAQRGGAVSALSYLLDRTLHGWYRLARVQSFPLGQAFRRMSPSTIPPVRLERARALGATAEVEDLLRMVAKFGTVDVLIGPAHGDLHANNIRVRKSEAVVIDFLAQLESGVPLIDLANLEASLLEGYRDDAHIGEKRVREWIDSIGALYADDPFGVDIEPCHPKDEWHWFHTCVGIIRRHARTMQRGHMQYAGALVVAFLRRASRDPDANEPEATRKAVAFVLAERLANVVLAQEGGA